MNTFATTAPITAHLDIPAGRIQFIGADRADATVEVRPADASKSRDVKAAEETKVEFANGVLRVTAPNTNQMFGNSGFVEVTVQLPAGSRVDVKTASADLRGVGRLGDVTVESAHGTVKFDETAAARISLQAGDITVGRLSGSAELNTQKGDIRIAEAMGGTATLRTEAGDINVGVARGVSAVMDSGTSYGRILNALNNSADAAAQLHIHATTAYGNIAARSL